MFDGLGDDTGSVRSALIGTQIPLQNFVRSESEIEASILEFASGCTTDIASKLQGNYQNLINQMNFGGKKSESSKINIPEMVFGRNLFEGVTKCLNRLGEIVFTVVITNYDLTNLQNSRLKRRNELLEKIREIEKDLSESNLSEPNEKYFFMQHTVRMHDAEKLARETFIASLETLSIGEVVQEELAKRRGATPSFDRSSHAQDFAKLKAFEEIDWQRKYISAVEEYKMRLLAEKQKKNRVNELKNDIQRDNIIEQVCFALVTSIQHIATKIKDAVDDFCPEMKSKLQGSIRLSNNVILTDPFSSPNLAGLYMALYTQYNKANISIFCKQLLDLLDEKSYDDPTKAISDVTSELKQWIQLDLWQYMDKDKLFVMALVRKLSTRTDVRKRAIERILSTAQKIESDEISPERLGELPLFDDLKEWLTNVYQRSYEMTRNQGNSKPFQKNNGQSSTTTARSYGTESAAAASAATPAAPSTVGSKETTFKMVDRVLSREVQRDEMLHCTNTDTGRRNLYTATKIPCPKCSSKDESIMHPKPRCYLAKCTKCGLFGHKHPDCHQKVEKATGLSASEADDQDRA